MIWTGSFLSAALTLKIDFLCGFAIANTFAPAFFRSFLVFPRRLMFSLALLGLDKLLLRSLGVLSDKLVRRLVPRLSVLYRRTLLLLGDGLIWNTFLLEVAWAISDEAMRVATVTGPTSSMIGLIQGGLSLVALLHGLASGNLRSFGHIVVEFFFLSIVLIRRGEAARELEQIA